MDTTIHRVVVGKLHLTSSKSFISSSFLLPCLSLNFRVYRFRKYMHARAQGQYVVLVAVVRPQEVLQVSLELGVLRRGGRQASGARHSTHMTRRLGILLELEEVRPLIWRWNHLRWLGLRPRLLWPRLIVLGRAHSSLDRDQIVVLYPYLLIRHTNQIG